MMTRNSAPEVERRALALFERLADYPGNKRFRDRLLKRETATVLSRLSALEASVGRATKAIPTLIPGSADAGEVAIPPARVGAFRLVERIGRGGMGDVWEGHRDDGLYDQKVAIKLIQLHALRRASAAFDDERRFLARLEHPHIARLIDGGVTEDGLPWLVIEYVEGRPIDEATIDLPIAEKVRLLIMAAEAVQFAHSRMIAHADLKPANIMVDVHGRVKLLDFGIAALIGGDDQSASSPAPMSRDFASPQRLAGERPSVSDDVFAFGKTMACVLGSCDDREVAAIVAKAQAYDPALRYGSVQALINDLQRWQARLPVSALPSSRRYAASKFIERHRIGIAATTAALVMLAGSSIVAMSSYFSAERSRVTAEARFGEVRHLSGFMLFDLYDSLAQQPGTVAKRAEIAQTSALYLDRLQVAADAPADLRLETARSYRRLAAIQGLPGTSNLGQPEKARTSLDRAEAMLRQLIAQDAQNAAALTELGWVFSDRWALHAENIDSVRTNNDARAAFDRALAIAPTDPLARLGRLQTDASAAYDMIWSADQPAKAVAAVKPTLASLRAIKWPGSYTNQVAALQIRLLNTLGDGIYYSGDIEGSIAPYREADALIDRMIALQGPLPVWLIRKGEAAFNISGSLAELPGRRAEALDIVRKGLGSLRQLLTFGPDAAAEKKLLVLLGEEASLLSGLGRIREALVPSLASVTLREQRLAGSPHNPQRLRDLAIGTAPYAELLAKSGQRAKACTAAKRAVGAWTELKATNKLGKLDARKNLTHAVKLQADFCAS